MVFFGSHRVALSLLRTNMKNKINIITFIKNEELLINSFLKYHQNIVDNIYVIDHASTDKTLNIISQYKNINLTHYDGDFDNKGEICTNIIKNMDTNLVIPLDADERIVYDDGFTISDDTDLIRLYLQNLTINGHVYKINNIYNQLNNTQYNIYNNIVNYPKLILPSKTFISINCGFHNAVTRLDNSIFNNINISYIHYHYINKQYWKDSCKKKLQSRLKEKYQDIDAIRELVHRRTKSHNVAQEYLHYLETGQWCTLNANKKLELTNLTMQIENDIIST